MPLFQSEDSIELSDAELIVRHRGGDPRAYAQLWERHYTAGVKAARAITGSHDPDDLVQESFTRILSTLSNGRGPTENFRAYLYATIRSVSISWSGKIEPTIDITTAETALVTDEDLMAVSEDKRLTVRAFKDLPEDWRTVLWYTEIEGMTPAEISPLMGLSPRAVSALSFRAREGLREAWLNVHLPSSAADSSDDCKWSEKHLSSYARGSLTAKRTTRLEDHLRDCTQCSILLAELNLVGRNLRAALLPLFLGLAPAALDKVFPFVVTGGAGVASSSSTASGPFGQVKNWCTSNQVGIAAGIAAAIAIVVTAMTLTGQNDPAPAAEPTSSVAPSESLSDDSQQAHQPADSNASDEPADEPTSSPSHGTAWFSGAAPTHAHVPPAHFEPTVDHEATPSPTPTSAAPKPESTPRVEPTAKPTVEPTAEPTVEPTTEPTVEPTVSPTVDPTVEPTVDPSPEPTDGLEVTSVSDTSTTDLMPRFTGTAPAGSQVQLFDASQPSLAVSELVTVTGSGTATSVASTAQATTTGLQASVLEPSDSSESVTGTVTEIGDWTLDVSSTAPTGRGLTYVVKNFVAGELISTTPIAQSFTVNPVDPELFSVCEVKEYGSSGTTIPNNGTLVTTTAREQLEVAFQLRTSHVGNFQFFLNGEKRSTQSSSGADTDWRWAKNTVPIIDSGNTIGIRVSETKAGEAERFGPLTSLFTFSVSADGSLASADQTAGTCP